MVSSRLRQLAPDADRLGYLDAIDGFWADLVLAECAFLEDRGYTLKEVSFHQQGDYVLYAGPRGSVLFDFFPDNLEIGGSATLSDGTLSFDGPLAVLAMIEDPATSPPTRLPITREVVEACIRYWTNALRSAKVAGG